MNEPGLNDTKRCGTLHAQLRIDFVSVELTTARTVAGIAKIEVRHNDLPGAREALNQVRRA